MINAEKGVEKREPFYSVGGYENGITMEHTLEVPLKTRNRTTIFIQQSHSWAYTQEKKS